MTTNTPTPQELYKLLDTHSIDYDVVEVFEGVRILRVEVNDDVESTLTLEDVAFVDAYCNAVAVAPREEVVRFISVDSEYRSSREFYDSMSEYYTSIADAREVWYQAMQFAKGVQNADKN